MGSVVSLYEQLWSKNVEIIVVGLDNAGKSSLLNLLAHGHHAESTPTVSDITLPPHHTTKKKNG